MRHLLRIALVLCLGLAASAQTVRIQGQELSYRIVDGHQMVSRALLAKAFPGIAAGQGEVDLAELARDPNARVLKRDGLVVSIRYYDTAMAAFYQATRQPGPELAANPGKSQQPTASDQRYQFLMDEVVRLSNLERQNHGAGALAVEKLLEVAAAGHSQEMAALGYFAHESPTPGRETPHDRILLTGCAPRKTGENLGKLSPSPDAELAQRVVTGWMNSPGHRANLLDPGFTHIGIGVAVGADGSYFITQNFCAY